jgi:hypothetical protein
LLQAKIKGLQQELNVIAQKLSAFETILRSHLTNEIIEEQELTVLYKKLQKEKKEKRLLQKQKGKKFKKVEGLNVIHKKITEIENQNQLKEKKRLYREAMLFVHPDKFSMQEDKVDLATEVTAKLIEIYQTGNLEELQLYHSHIFSGDALPNVKDVDKINEQLQGNDSYLKKELEQLLKRLAIIKSSHTYKVLTEYENPLTFIDELKEYYVDRIFKLKKRTRKVRV